MFQKVLRAYDIVSFIRSLLEYSRPASGATDAEWNEWVHEMLDQILQLENFGFERPIVVSFIDS
jgi:hypothetical protein